VHGHGPGLREGPVAREQDAALGGGEAGDLAVGDVEHGERVVAEQAQARGEPPEHLVGDEARLPGGGRLRRADAIDAVHGAIEEERVVAA
jgi:hypothetical protein